MTGGLCGPEHGGLVRNRNLCGCDRYCGDDGDVDGPGICKGFPVSPQPPLVEVVLVRRDDRVLGICPHGVDLDRAFCPKGCRV